MEKAVLVQTVERTFNGLFDAEADEQCGAKRYERPRSDGDCSRDWRSPSGGRADGRDFAFPEKP